MWILLPLALLLCATSVHSIFEGTCLRKEPPPGVLVLPPGSKLDLTCSGHVKVDGVTVRNGSNSNRWSGSSDATPTTVNVITKSRVSVKSGEDMVRTCVSEGCQSNATVVGEKRTVRQTDTRYTASPSPYMVQPSSAQRLPKADERDGEDVYEEEGEEGSRVTRGIKLRSQWKWIGRKAGKGRGEILFERREATLSLSSVRLTDSATYTCYQKGRESFSLKVIVADPPENPSMSCYKKSPSSKIRCEWTPQKPMTIRPNCFLLLSKRQTEMFHRLPCSYSTKTSRCWCAVDHVEDDKRTVHMAYLCVTSIAGNATSSLQHFTPLWIIKPDPPSNISVRQQEGHERKMIVTWIHPASWKSQDNFYELIYELKYRPLLSSLQYAQVQQIGGGRSYTITDAMPGVEYWIQLRTKEKYDGMWSDWSEPVNASSWTTPRTDDDLTTTMFPSYFNEGSGTDNSVADVPHSTDVPELVVSPDILWIPAVLAIMLVILAVYIFRRKDRLMSKDQSLSMPQCGVPPQSPPIAPAASEGQALVTFGPPWNKNTTLSKLEEGEEKNAEEQCLNERREAMHFSNTSYFFLQQD